MEVTKPSNAEKKRYLWQYQEKVKASKRIAEQIEELRRDKQFPSFIVSDMPRGNKMTDLSQYMAILDELEREMQRVRYEKIKIYSKIFRNIENLENENEKNVLTMKYIKGFTFERIACEMKYSWRQIQRIHGQALYHFEIMS